MSINALLVSQELRFELPLGSDMIELEKFFKGKGFCFNPKRGEFEYREEKEEPKVLATWRMKGIPNGIRNTVSMPEGKPLPFLEQICNIIYPEEPSFVYEMRLKACDINKFVWLLFGKKYEVVSLSINGIYQIYQKPGCVVTIQSLFRDEYKIKFTGSKAAFLELFNMNGEN
jgi:hypothetical protein